ncbi:hypothetical protein D1872_295460 [compost metagenome]
MKILVLQQFRHDQPAHVAVFDQNAVERMQRPAFLRPKQIKVEHLAAVPVLNVNFGLVNNLE